MVVIKLFANLASTMYNFVKIACNVALIKSILILDIICPFQQRKSIYDSALTGQRRCSCI